MNQLSIIITLIILIKLTYESLKFPIPTDREKCFIEEIGIGDSILIRWDIAGLPEDKEKADKAISNIRLTVRSSTGEQIHSKAFPNKKDKIVLTPKTDGSFYICTRYYEGWGERQPQGLYMGLKISSQYTLDVNYSKALGKESVVKLDNRIEHIHQKILSSTKIQDRDIKEELETATAILKSSTLYFNLTVIQLIAVIGVGMYQILMFKKYLSINKII